MFNEHEEDSFLKKDVLNDESQHGLELRVLSIVGGILILAAAVYVVMKTMRSHSRANVGAKHKQQFTEPI